MVNNPPPVSKIKNSDIREVSFQDYKEFKIIPSTKKGKLNLILTPDFAICDDCKKEILDPKNKRFNYPFTTCVNCGPRWAITKIFPFERNNTSIDAFEMCNDCNIEFKNPSNRRFHSQTNSCPTCGISFSLDNANGSVLCDKKEEIFKKVNTLLKEGNIISIKNTGGYLLCCDATNKEVVKRLREKKKRPNKPFAILYPTLQLLEHDLTINEYQKKLLKSTETPIVIVSKLNFNGNLVLNELAPNLNQLGVMLPYSGILQLLANELDRPIVATSGNLHGSPIISNNKIATEVLSEISDYFLHHNLKIINPQDDSVIKISFKYNQEVIFRRSRGYAPNYFNSTLKTEKKIMAMGGHLKSSISYLPNDNLYISQYLGNLDHFDVYERYVKNVFSFINLFEQKPDIVLIDKHPANQSSIFGREISKKWKTELVEIQHHKAHFASVLGEYELFNQNEPVLGVVWDGTGFGDDGNIWGSEFFSFRSKKIERIIHFAYFDWLSADKMAREPRLSFLSLANSSMNQQLHEKFPEGELRIYDSIKNKNKLKTSSVGRLFDAVSSLLGICDLNTYEGEAAILLENRISNYDLSSCKSYYTVLDNRKIVTYKLFENLFLDYKKGETIEKIILNFLFTLASIVLKIATVENITKIALSGGVFQNTVLMDMLIELNQNKFELYFNRNLSPNDENISFGQIMYYLNCK